MNFYRLLMTLRAPEGEPSGGGGAPEVPPSAQPPAPVSDAEPASEPPAPSPAPPKAVAPVMDVAAIDRKIKRAREQGAQDAAARLDEEAKALGFKSHDEMKQAAKRALAARKAAKKSPDAAAPAEPVVPAASSAAESNRERIARSRMARKLSARTQEARELKRRNMAIEAEMDLRVAAAQAGLRDVDYAMHFLRKYLAGKSEAEIAAFDEHAFFNETFKKSHPYLYGAVEEPATTSASSSRAPAPPPAKPAAASVPDDQVDARKMSREDYIKHLRSKGLAAPDQGLSF